MCSPIWSLKYQKSPVFLSSSWSVFMEFQVTAFLDLKYLITLHSLLPIPPDIAQLLTICHLYSCSGFLADSPRSFVLILHSFINFTRIILCTQIKGKIMVLLCTKNLSFLWSEENCLRISFKGCHGLNIVYLELSTVPFSHIRALTLARMYLALLRKFCHLNSFLPLLLPGKSLLLLVELDFTYSMKTCLFPQSEFIFYFHVLIIICSSSFLFIYAFKNYSVKFVDNLLRAEHGN